MANKSDKEISGILNVRQENKDLKQEVDKLKKQLKKEKKKVKESKNERNSSVKRREKVLAKNNNGIKKRKIWLFVVIGLFVLSVGAVAFFAIKPSDKKGGGGADKALECADIIVDKEKTQRVEVDTAGIKTKGQITIKIKPYDKLQDNKKSIRKKDILSYLKLLKGDEEVTLTEDNFIQTPDNAEWTITDLNPGIYTFVIDHQISRKKKCEYEHFKSRINLNPLKKEYQHGVACEEENKDCQVYSMYSKTLKNTEDLKEKGKTLYSKNKRAKHILKEWKQCQQEFDNLEPKKQCLHTKKLIAKKLAEAEANAKLAKSEYIQSLKKEEPKGYEIEIIKCNKDKNTTCKDGGTCLHWQKVKIMLKNSHNLAFLTNDDVTVTDIETKIRNLSTKEWPAVGGIQIMGNRGCPHAKSKLKDYLITPLKQRRKNLVE